MRIILSRHNKKSAFTLIEMLVVISIVALIAAIVFIAVRNSRISAKETRIITNLTNFRKAAAAIASSNTGGSFQTPQDVCISREFDDIRADNNNLAGSDPVCFSDDAGFCIYQVYAEKQTAGASTVYCIDSNGKLWTGSVGGTGKTCDAGNKRCH